MKLKEQEQNLEIDSKFFLKDNITMLLEMSKQKITKQRKN